jgi:subtilisin family serine protease
MKHTTPHPYFTALLWSMTLACAVQTSAAARLLIKWKDGPNSPAAVAGHAQVGGRVKRNFNALGWQLIELPMQMSGTDGIAAYRALGSITAVEPDGTWRVQPLPPPPTNDLPKSMALNSLAIPNDPNYGSQWYLPRIGAPQAWGTTTGSTNVVVAIFDTGVDYNHPDLAANMWRNPGESGLDPQGHDKATNGIDDDGNGYVDDVYGINVLEASGDPMDTGVWISPSTNRTYHGTHVAGFVGAVGNNGVGIAGINWSVKIMAIRCLGGDFADPNSERGLWSDILAAWDYVITMKRRGVNVRVTNHSYGEAVYSSAVEDVVRLASTEGILTVCATGNSALDQDLFLDAPSGFSVSSVISVGASTEADVLWSSSDYGASTVDIVAPGVNLFSTWKDGTYRGGLSGNSGAAPQVAGAAALLLSVNPNLTVNELKAAIFGSVDQSAALRGKVVTNGRLNVARALEYLTNANPPAIVITALPAGQAAINAPIQVAFNRAMDCASVESAFVIRPPIAGTFAWADDNRSFAFHHETPFDVTTNYAIRILGTASDETGATLDGNFNRTREGSPGDDFVWTFRFRIANDDFANAQLLAGPSGSIQGSNRYTTSEVDEMFGLLFGDWRTYGSSVWYQWTAPTDGWVTFDLTSGTTFDSLLAVFTGDQPERLVAVATNDNHGSNQGSRVSLDAFAGTNYSVLVAGKDTYNITKAGNFQLRWYSTPAPVVANFSPTAAYPGQAATINGTNFTGVTRVLFNGVSAAFAFATNAALLDLTLGVTVPPGAMTGPLTIETPHGNFTTSSNFTVLVLPTMAIQSLPGNLVELNWLSTPGFTLQRTDSLTPNTTWATASILSSRLSNGIRYVTVTNTMPNRFFRLYRP